MEQNQPPMYVPPTVDQPSNNASLEIVRSNKRKLIWGLICLIAPTLLIPVAFVAYAVINFVVSSSGPSPDSGNLFHTAGPPIWATILNIVLFIIGAASIILWLPGIIVGIILLAKRQSL